jgi:hypothetical protein
MNEATVRDRVPVVACTPCAWVRGILEISHTRRLLDVLNRPGTSYLRLADGEVLPYGATEWPRPQPWLYVNKTEILFVHPAAGSARSRPSDLTVEKTPVVVSVYLGEYCVRGTVHMPDRLPCAEYFGVLRDPFVALTEVTITRTALDEEVARVEFAAINRVRVTVLSEA